MIHIRILFVLIFNVFSVYAFAMPDVKTCKPQLIKPIANWAIIADNDVNISASDAFSGNNIIYSVEAHSHNKANKISIGAGNGALIIRAGGKDNFDVIVSAANECGSTSTKFNVQVDEEKL